MQSLDIPADLPTEILVVDNDSSDGTRHLVEAFECPNVPVRYILEPHIGQCWARNAGIARAGDYILFTDDDVIVPRDWVVGMVEPMRHGAADAVQGGIRLPPHIKRRLPPGIDPWRFTELLPESGPRYKPNFLIGANMAFKRSILERVPAFDVELGPGQLGFGDDTLFGLQLVEAGYRIALHLNVAVEHHFDPGRVRRCSYCQKMPSGCASSAYIVHHWEHSHVSFVAIRLAWQQIKLLAIRTIDRSGMLGCGISERENALTTRVGFYKQLLRVRRTPRKYERHGLIKIGA